MCYSVRHRLDTRSGDINNAAITLSYINIDTGCPFDMHTSTVLYGMNKLEIIFCDQDPSGQMKKKNIALQIHDFSAFNRKYLNLRCIKDGLSKSIQN